MARNRKTALTPMQYWQKYGQTHCERLCQVVGMSYGYWKRICNLRARPGLDLARRLEDLTEGEMTVETLCPPRAELRLTGAPPMVCGNPIGSRRKSAAQGVA